MPVELAAMSNKQSQDALKGFDLNGMMLSRHVKAVEIFMF